MRDLLGGEQRDPVREIEELLREHQKLRQEIERAEQIERRSHFDRRQGERRGNQDR